MTTENPPAWTGAERRGGTERRATTLAWTPERRSGERRKTNCCGTPGSSVTSRESTSSPFSNNRSRPAPAIDASTVAVRSTVAPSLMRDCELRRPVTRTSASSSSAVRTISLHLPVTVTAYVPTWFSAREATA